MTQLTIEEWQARLKKAIYNADRQTSKLSGFYKEVFGLTSPRIKDLLNNICDHESVKYLEMGVFRASTLVAASVSDCKISYGVDNFSYSPYDANKWNPDGWSSIRRAAKDNIERARIEKKVKIIESDIRDQFMDLSKVIPDKINVVFCDLTHLKPEEIMIALKQSHSTTENLYVLLVGLYVDLDYQRATQKFIKDNKLTVHFEEKLLSEGRTNNNGWYGGIGLFLLEKPKPKIKGGALYAAPPKK